MCAQLLTFAASGTRPESAADEAAFVLRRMAERPNVLLAASNPYDWLYLRWSVGLDATPWVGLSVQLSTIGYTGTRPQALFCCGSSAYNKGIKAVADTIVNASRAQLLRSHQTRLEFAWLADLYPKSWHCSKVTLV